MWRREQPTCVSAVVLLQVRQLLERLVAVKTGVLPHVVVHEHVLPELLRRRKHLVAVLALVRLVRRYGRRGAEWTEGERAEGRVGAVGGQRQRTAAGQQLWFMACEFLLPLQRHFRLVRLKPQRDAVSSTCIPREHKRTH